MGKSNSKQPKTSAKKAASDASPRHAVGTDADIKAANLRRMARVEGQVRGIKQMIEDERYCADILQQISAAQNAMRAVAKEVLRNHLKHCVHKALTSDPKQAECMQEELLKLFDKRV